MNFEQFTYWLQGAIELGGVKEFNEQQTTIIQDHLNVVFNKITPNRNLYTGPKLGVGIDPNFAIDPKKWMINDQPGILSTVTC